MDDEEQPKTRYVRIGYATTDDGQLDIDRIGTIEELPYLDAKTLTKAGRGQYVDGPDLEPPADTETSGATATAKSRIGDRWGDGAGKAPARPGAKTEPAKTEEA